MFASCTFAATEANSAAKMIAAAAKPLMAPCFHFLLLGYPVLGCPVPPTTKLMTKRRPDQSKKDCRFLHSKNSAIFASSLRPKTLKPSPPPLISTDKQKRRLSLGGDHLHRVRPIVQRTNSSRWWPVQPPLAVVPQDGAGHTVESLVQQSISRSTTLVWEVLLLLVLPSGKQEHVERGAGPSERNNRKVDSLIVLDKISLRLVS